MILRTNRINPVTLPTPFIGIRGGGASKKEYIKGHVTNGATSITIKINNADVTVPVGADGWFVWKKPKDLVITSLKETLLNNTTVNELYICLDLSTINDYNRFWGHNSSATTMANMIIDLSKSEGELHGDFDHFLYRSHPTPVIFPNVGTLYNANNTSAFGSRTIPVFGGYIKTNFNFSNLVNLQESNVVNIFSAIAKDGITLTFHPTVGAMIDAQMDAGEGAIYEAYMNSDYEFSYNY